MTKRCWSVVTRPSCPTIVQMCGRTDRCSVIRRHAAAAVSRFTTRPLAEGEHSLLDLLRADRWEEDRILDQLRRARTLTTQRQDRQGRERSPISRSRPDENLTDNLLSLGEG